MRAGTRRRRPMLTLRYITAGFLFLNTTLPLGLACYYAMTVVAIGVGERRLRLPPLVPAIEHAGLGCAIFALALQRTNLALVGVLTILLASTLEWREPAHAIDRPFERQVLS